MESRLMEKPPDCFLWHSFKEAHRPHSLDISSSGVPQADDEVPLQIQRSFVSKFDPYEIKTFCKFRTGRYRYDARKRAKNEFVCARKSTNCINTKSRHNRLQKKKHRLTKILHTGYRLVEGDL